MRLIDTIKELIYTKFPHEYSKAKAREPLDVHVELTEKSYHQFNKEIIDMMNENFVIDSTEGLDIKTDKIEFRTLMVPPYIYIKVDGIGKITKDTMRVGDKTICIDFH
jgi:hypothetical protein